MSDLPEVIASALFLDTTEQTIGTLSKWWPMVDVYASGGGLASSVGAVVRLYTIAQGKRALLASVTIGPGTQDRVISVPGSGTTIEATVQGASGTAASKTAFGVVGWDPNAEDTQASASGNPTLSASAMTQVAVLAWQPRLDVIVDGVSIPASKGSVWEVWAVLGVGPFEFRVTQGVYARSGGGNPQRVLAAVGAGAASFKLYAQSPGGPCAPTGVIAGYSQPVAVPPNAVGNIVLPNLAALEAFDVSSFEDGTIAWVQTLRTTFAVETSAVATDGITVVASTAPGRRWFRAVSPDLSWALQPAWFIDPQNTSGHASDENDGAAAGRPLATNAELFRRWRKQVLALLQYTVTYVSGAASPSDAADDPFCLDVFTRPNSVGGPLFLDLFGPAPTVVRSGSFTGVTQINAAANQALEVTDAAMAGSWGPNVGQRARITAGPRAGCVAWVAKDLGGQTARLSPFVTTPDEGFNTLIEQPQIGDAYDVETLGIVNLAILNVQSVGNGAQATDIRIHNIDTGDGNEGPINITMDPTVALEFCYGKTFSAIEGGNSADLYFFGALDNFTIQSTGQLSYTAGLSIAN